jgi:hypothetical protein
VITASIFIIPESLSPSENIICTFSFQPELHKREAILLIIKNVQAINQMLDVVDHNVSDIMVLSADIMVLSADIMVLSADIMVLAADIMVLAADVRVLSADITVLSADNIMLSAYNTL